MYVCNGSPVAFPAAKISNNETFKKIQSINTLDLLVAWKKLKKKHIPPSHIYH